VEAGGEGVVLIVVEVKEARGGRREIGEAAGDAAGAFGGLARVGETKLDAAGEAGRAQRPAS